MVFTYNVNNLTKLDPYKLNNLVKLEDKNLGYKLEDNSFNKPLKGKVKELLLILGLE